MRTGDRPVPARALTSSAPAPRDLRQTSVRSGRPHHRRPGPAPAGGGPAVARAGGADRGRGRRGRGRRGSGHPAQQQQPDHLAPDGGPVFGPRRRPSVREPERAVQPRAGADSARSCRCTTRAARTSSATCSAPRRYLVTGRQQRQQLPVGPGHAAAAPAPSRTRTATASTASRSTRQRYVRDGRRERQHLPVERGQRQGHRHLVQRQPGQRPGGDQPGRQHGRGGQQRRQHLPVERGRGAESTSTSSFHDPGGKNVYGVAFSPDGTPWRPATPTAAPTCGTWPPASSPPRLTDPGSQGLYDVAFSPDGKAARPCPTCRAAPPTASSTCGTWPPASSPPRWPSFYDSDFADIAFTPDGRFLAAGDTIGNVSFWNVATGKYLRTLSDPLGKSVIGVAFSPAGDLLASTDTAGDAYVWNTKWLGS